MPVAVGEPVEDAELDPRLRRVVERLDLLDKKSGFSAAELRELADDCRLNLDLPYEYSEPDQMDAQRGASLGLDEKQRASYNRIIAQGTSQFLSKVRQLYSELTGDSGDDLDLSSLINEIQLKANPDDLKTVPDRLAKERAGMLPPPHDLQGTSVYERYLRLVSSVGDELQAALASELAPTVVARIREEWRGLSLGGGCSHLADVSEELEALSAAIAE